MQPLTIAVPKGRLLGPIARLLAEAGLDCGELSEDNRRLMVSDGTGAFRFILARAKDVPTYVEYGAADLGIVGRDVLLESPRNVAELLDLAIGRCRVVVAVPGDSPVRDVQQLDFNTRVATKYPRIATAFFNEQGIQVEIIPLSGSIELSVMVGLADVIVDITETGRTLRENGLVVLTSIAEVTCRLIANPVRLKLHHPAIESLVESLRQRVGEVAA